MADYLYRVPEDYHPVMVDYHYRLEWDLVKEYEFAARHQVRIFDQGGEDGWNNFMSVLALMEQAKAQGMIENLSGSHREVRLDDWEAGWPTFPPGLGLNGPIGSAE